MLTTEVSRYLGISETRVRQLDARLAPERTATGVRVYKRAEVERLAAERRAARRTP